jgi:hypothetical protein
LEHGIFVEGHALDQAASGHLDVGLGAPHATLRVFVAGVFEDHGVRVP